MCFYVLEIFQVWNKNKEPKPKGEIPQGRISWKCEQEVDLEENELHSMSLAP